MEEQPHNPSTEKPVTTVGVGTFSYPSILKLPNSILVDILSRLPIKTVIHCRCVCKYFHYLISQDSEFPPLHLSKCPAELLLWNPNMKKMLIVDSKADHAHQIKLIRLEGMEIVNSCRGLICLRPRDLSEPVCVMNPITREFTLIPNPPIYRKINRVPVWVGLGYSPKSDQYKVLKFIKVSNSNDVDQTYFFAMICTLGTTPPSWRRIKGRQLDELTDCFSTFLNGCLHFVMKEDYSEYYYSYMIYFNFDNEEFGQTTLPSTFDGSGVKPRDMVKVVNFGVFEGLLSICVLDDEGSIIVWVMMEYGVSKSWCRKFVVDVSSRYRPVSYLFPVKYVNNDKAHVLLFIVDKVLITFNILDMEIVRFNTVSTYKVPVSKAFMFVPTLVSLKELVVGADVNLLKPTTSSRGWRRCRDSITTLWRRCRDWSDTTPNEKSSRWLVSIPGEKYSRPAAAGS